MLKRSLLAVAVLCICASSSFADVFLSFEQGDQARSSAIGSANVSDGTGSAFIYSNAGFNFSAFDLDLSIVDNSVISLTNATIFNPEIRLITPDILLGFRWDTPVTASNTATTARLLGVAVSEEGINVNLASLDPDFDEDADAFLIGRIDYDIVGVGTVDINLALGENEFFDLETPDVLIQPTLNSGTLIVAAVPEPSTMSILALSLVGFVARRRR